MISKSLSLALDCPSEFQTSVLNGQLKLSAWMSPSISNCTWLKQNYRLSALSSCQGCPSMVFLYSLLLKPKPQKWSLIPPFFSPIGKSWRFYLSSISSPILHCHHPHPKNHPFLPGLVQQPSILGMVPFLPPSNPSSMTSSQGLRYTWWFCNPLPGPTVLHVSCLFHSSISPSLSTLFLVHLDQPHWPPFFLQTQLTPYHPIYFLHSTENFNSLTYEFVCLLCIFPLEWNLHKKDLIFLVPHGTHNF